MLWYIKERLGVSDTVVFTFGYNSFVFAFIHCHVHILFLIFDALYRGCLQGALEDSIGPRHCFICQPWQDICWVSSWLSASLSLLNAQQCDTTKLCTLYPHIPYRCCCIVLDVHYSNLWKEPVSSLHCHASAVNRGRSSPGVTSHSPLFTVLGSVTYSHPLVLSHLASFTSSQCGRSRSRSSILIHAAQMIMGLNEPVQLAKSMLVYSKCNVFFYAASIMDSGYRKRIVYDKWEGDLEKEMTQPGLVFRMSTRAQCIGEICYAKAFFSCIFCHM